MNNSQDKQSRECASPQELQSKSNLKTNIFEFSNPKNQKISETEISSVIANQQSLKRDNLRSILKITNRQNRLMAASAEISQTLKDEHLKSRLEYYQRHAGIVIRLDTLKKS